MNLTLIFILGILIGGAAVLFFYLPRRQAGARPPSLKATEGQGKEATRERGIADKFIGICEYARRVAY